MRWLLGESGVEKVGGELMMTAGEVDRSGEIEEKDGVSKENGWGVLRMEKGRALRMMRLHGVTVRVCVG